MGLKGKAHSASVSKWYPNSLMLHGPSAEPSTQVVTTSYLPWQTQVQTLEKGLGFRVQGLGFRVQGLGFRV